MPLSIRHAVIISDEPCDDRFAVLELRESDKALGYPHLEWQSGGETSTGVNLLG